MSDPDDSGRPAGIVHDYAAIAKGEHKLRREREAAIAGRPPDPDMADLIKPKGAATAPPAPLPEDTLGHWSCVYKSGKTGRGDGSSRP